MTKKLQGQQPMVIMGDEAQRILGRDAQRMNILAARAVGEVVKTTLGPKGMDKMLVDTLGDIVVTGDGVTILKEMEIEHPAAKMVVEVAKTQEDIVGDGTTTAVILTGELLRRAEELLNQNIHPSIIVNGYRMAAAKAQEVLEKNARDIKISDKKIFVDIAVTTMKGRVTEASSDHLAKLVVDGVSKIAETENSNPKVNIDNLKVEKKAGGSLDDSELISGIIVDKERVHSGMPTRVENAKIALVNSALEIEKTETDASIRITSPEQLEAFMMKEEDMLKKMVDKIAATGATVLFVQKGIDDLAQHYLSKKGILAVRRVKESDMTKLSRATGAKIATSLDDLSKSDLGHSKIVKEEKLAGDSMIFVRECRNPKAVTILIRGGTEHIIDEAERSISDAIKVVGKSFEEHKIVSGGGAPEIEVALALKKYAPKVGGREQLAIEAFSAAMEIIPRTLAENGGLDPIDILVSLKAAHEKGQTEAGVDVLEGKIANLGKKGIIEPLLVKTQAIKSASETAMMILKIDDVIAAGELKGGGPPPGMPPGMGGMPGM